MKFDEEICLDDFGRVILKDPALLEAVKGAASMGAIVPGTNRGCHDNVGCGNAGCANGGC